MEQIGAICNEPNIYTKKLASKPTIAFISFWMVDKCVNTSFHHVYE